ncbi:Glycosyltransferase involved in cell wall bisynthesis [Marivirga sericea]|uniref:Glycosyltransferase involved in cell wall bisynthesis n=1 Tax=Marivirga sericea TaxID=1028 RepID=A0A1X7IMV6_9BACT|nr:glycosyltransferase [Marivirga sericea]SMG16347.1 Glycosyltransferase involved in cell wall bisynthesis [Marivirga sericea]
MDDKIKVLIASVLKPADDVRSCYKIGQSLAQTNKYEVNIIGFESKKKVENENIFLYPIFKFQRNSFKRLYAPVKVFKKYLKLKPQLIIINTPELLWVMFLIKILFGTKIIYDVQENYQFNISQNQIYRGLPKYLFKYYIKITESLSRYFVEGFLLAEEVYEQQLSFIHHKPYIKLLNKSILSIKQEIEPLTLSKNNPLKFIYSGTIGAEYGTLDAIELCKKIHYFNSKITLIIIGYSADSKYLKIIEKAVNKVAYIKLITNNKPIAQSAIIQEIKNSDVALLPYRLNPNLAGRFPTKIYDYLALHIPMIIPPHPEWKSYLHQYSAGLTVDFNTPDVERLQKELHNSSFFVNRPKEEILWKSQESELLHFVEKILS